MRTLIELQYLPPISYFTLLAHSEEIWIESKEHFEKQSYRNRTEILGSNQVQRLTVPVHSANSGLPIQKMQIDHRQKWINQHWRAIQSAYGKAPFYDYYASLFEKEIYKKTEQLFELNHRLLTLCLRALGLRKELKFTQTYVKSTATGILDMRSEVHPKKAWDSLSWFKPVPYYQVFGKDFVPNLSILDLLFCMGPESLMVIKESGVFKENK